MPRSKPHIGIAVSGTHFVALLIGEMEHTVIKEVPRIVAGLEQHLIQLLFLLESVRIDLAVDSVPGLIRVSGGALCLRALPCLLLLQLVLTNELLKGLWRNHGYLPLRRASLCARCIGCLSNLRPLLWSWSGLRIRAASGCLPLRRASLSSGRSRGFLFL